MKELVTLGSFCLMVSAGMNSFGQAKVSVSGGQQQTVIRQAVAVSADEIIAISKTKNSGNVVTPVITKSESAVQANAALSSTDTGTEIALEAIADPEILKEAEIIKANNEAILRGKNQTDKQ